MGHNLIRRFLRPDRIHIPSPIDSEAHKHIYAIKCVLRITHTDEQGAPIRTEFHFVDKCYKCLMFEKPSSSLIPDDCVDSYCKQYPVYDYTISKKWRLL